VFNATSRYELYVSTTWYTSVCYALWLLIFAVIIIVIGAMFKYQLGTTHQLHCCQWLGIWLKELIVSIIM
jgi:hypothetical protein